MDILTQCGIDMYMIAADMPQEYLQYLPQSTKSCSPLKPDTFLSMHLLGPLAILSKGHMENFGFHAVALTIIQARDWDKKGGDKENPVLIYLWSFSGFYKAWMLFPTTGRRRKKYSQMGKSRSKS